MWANVLCAVWVKYTILKKNLGIQDQDPHMTHMNIEA